MRVFKENDSIWVGLMIGATFPVLGFYLVEILFDFLTNQGLMAVSYTHLTLPTTPYV